MDENAMTARAGAAEAFRRLHGGGVLILPNAWDAVSARLIESVGARAIATTSAGVAWSLGYADGDLLPVPLLAAAVGGIARVVKVPVSADIEGGYSPDPARVGETVARVIDAGAVGINLEDGIASVDLLCAKIEQARRAAARSGVGLFVNARTDVYLKALAPAGARVAEVLARAERYRAAGADGLFVPAVTDPAEIRAIAAGTPLPLNILARPGLPAAAELEKLGVRRLSAGAYLSEAALRGTAALATAFLRTGASDPLTEAAMPYAEINALMGAG